VFDVFPLYICGIVFSSPYLFDIKAIFYPEEKKYHIFKDKAGYIVKSQNIKTNESIVNTRQIQRIFNANNSLVLMFEKKKSKMYHILFQLWSRS